MNIVVLMIDTLRYDHVRANGGQHIHTPNMDRIADTAWNFSRAFAASFPTIPHRTDTLTGQYGGPFHTWSPLDCDVPTLPETLSDEGYLTQLIHDSPHLVNGGHRFDLPFHTWTQIRGAETDRPWFTDDWSLLDNWEWDPMFDGLGYERNCKEVVQSSGHSLSRYLHSNRGRRDESEWTTAKLFTKASQFLEANASRDNFFLWLDCFDPHEPWDVPREYMRMYDDTRGYDGAIDPRALSVAKNHEELPEAGRERIIASYRANVTFMDRWLGEFLDTLEETGLSDRTAILLAGDHGTNLDGPPDRGFGKWDPPRQNEAHVPLFLDIPGAGDGHCDAIVQPQDVFATVANIGGGSIPEAVDSRDMVALAEGDEPNRRQIAVSGTAVETPGRRAWGDRDPDEIFFSVFDETWALTVTPDIDACELQRLGHYEDATEDNPAVVRRLYHAALDELDRRGLDPRISEWIRAGGGTDTFPREYSVSTSHPIPKGWERYWYHQLS